MYMKTLKFTACDGIKSEPRYARQNLRVSRGLMPCAVFRRWVMSTGQLSPEHSRPIMTLTSITFWSLFIQKSLTGAHFFCNPLRFSDEFSYGAVINSRRSRIYDLSLGLSLDCQFPNDDTEILFIIKAWP